MTILSSHVTCNKFRGTKSPLNLNPKLMQEVEVLNLKGHDSDTRLSLLIVTCLNYKKMVLIYNEKYICLPHWVLRGSDVTIEEDIV